MRAIGLSLVVVLFATAAHADSRSDAIDVIATMTAALADNNAPGFLKPLDRSMPGFNALEIAIPSLLAQGEIASSVEPLRDEGDDTKRTLQLDWYLEIRNLDETAPVVRRREVVRCVMTKREGRWRITSLDPTTFFEPENYTHK